jgi:multisubunit Na+/H+ antiporter MnhB subunit
MMRWVIGSLMIAFGGILVWGVMSLPGGRGLAVMVEKNMEMSGVTHPVTAILLNFRGYDTLLEIGVLLLALFGVYSLGRPRPDLADVSVSHPFLLALTQLLVPVMILMGGYLFWSGAYAPGGAFQAGAVLGAAGVLLYLNGIDLPGRKKEWLLRLYLAIGFVLFLGVGGGLVAAGNRLLEYPPDLAGSLIIMIEAGLTLSIGFILAELYISNSSSETVPDVFVTENG